MLFQIQLAHKDKKKKKQLIWTLIYYNINIFSEVFMYL